MTFYVGQKVVCVDDEGFDPRADHLHPVRGMVYTIRTIRTDKIRFTRSWQHTACLLVEIVKPKINWGEGVLEEGWDITRFRPLEEKPDAIEVFRAIALDPQRPLAPGGDGLDVRVPDDVHAFGGRPIL